MFANIYSCLSNAYNYLDSSIRNNPFIYNLIPVWFQMIAPALYSNIPQLEHTKPLFNSIYDHIINDKNNNLKNKNNPIINRIDPENMGSNNSKNNTKNNVIESKAEVKPKKKPIPKKIRDAVWVKYHGEKDEGICYACGRHVYRDNAGWQASHVIAEKSPDGKPGEITVDNLRVCCSGCNIGCGNGNLYVHIRDKNLKGPGSKNVDAYFKKNPSQINNKRTNNWGNNKKKSQENKVVKKNDNSKNNKKQDNSINKKQDNSINKNQDNSINKKQDNKVNNDKKDKGWLSEWM
jgi:hypothetical protein